MRRGAEAAHAAHVAALKARAAGRVESTRRDAGIALAAQEADLKGQAAVRVDAAVREAQAEAAQVLVDTMKQHDLELTSVRAEAQTDLARAEDRLADLEQALADREAQVPERIAVAVRVARDEAREEALRASADKARERELQVHARMRAEVARADARLAEFGQTLTAIRKKADFAQAEVARLLIERKEERRRQPADQKVQSNGLREVAANVITTTTAPGAVSRRGMAFITGAVVLAGIAGTLLGWYVFPGILH